MLYFSITSISLSSYCNSRVQRIHNMNSRSFKSTQHFMFKGGISTFLLKLPGCADKAAIISSGLTLLCGAGCHDNTSWGLRRAELSIPCCAFRAFRVHPGQLCLQLAVLFSVDLLRPFSHQILTLPKFLGCSAGEERGDLALRNAGGCAGQQDVELSPSAWQPACWRGLPAVWTQRCCSGAADTEEVLKGTSWRNEVRSVSLYLKISVLSLCRRIVVTTVHDCFVHRLDGYRQERGFLK